ncbi:protein-disulfide reductase DsbD family protein [Maricaulis maris]|uniref:Thiol:disulfide interchange protein DsbD n=1 Tax=Maricaulis maris TaxID=74318 RepID=A0A495DMU2_9PROT|nr:protein-disulfide reductase DsbD domain-containing protein [Maricaulis maris]RKR03970.1 thiol:disulfide interchange protein DsbD [Maricaulis maris]
MRVLRGLISLILLAGLPGLVMSAPGRAQSGWSSGQEIIEAQLVSDRAVVAPGEAFHIGLHQIMPEGWHTYWRNPGDNGLPVEIDWTLPAGVEIGEIVWPTPIELPLTDVIMDYGYKGELVLPMPVTVDPSYAGTAIELRADATWLVCDDICVPEERTLSLTLPVGATSERDEAGYWYIQGALDSEPQADPAISARLAVEGGQVILELDGPAFADAAAIRALRFFPYETGVIRNAGEQVLSAGEGSTLVAMEPGYAVQSAIREAQDGVVTWRDADGEHAVVISAEPGPGGYGLAPRRAATEAAGSAPVGLFGLVLLAFGGGLILNLMPCVFPVLSIKVLKFVQAAHANTGAVRRQGGFFLAGVLLSFVGLAAVLVVLREVGLPVGWGFQLQMPIVVAVLALLLFAIGLNLLGAFEVGTRLMGLGAGLADRPGWKGAFFTGVLAVVVAAPCVGPLAAGALGLALTQPAPVVLLVAAAMGLGLAAPFVVFSQSPGLLRFLPKPGAWMVTFRQFLAFPMFASVVWLGWVLAIQSGPTGLLLLGAAMLALAFAVWAHGLGHRIWSVTAVFALLLGVTSLVAIARLPASTSTQTLSAREEAWSRERVAELQAMGQPVFVDVTAAWCVTCQINKLTVLDSAAVEDAFDTLGVVSLRADWTNRNETIANLIAEHGQAGVPLYLLYPASGGEPRVLPTVLTTGGFVDALEWAANS